jgi:uncharacterized Tic20 family protein
MSRAPRRGPATLRVVRLSWYAVALVPIVLLVLAPLEGWVPGEIALIGLFLAVFWIFSFAFAIYARVNRPKEPRQ